MSGGIGGDGTVAEVAADGWWFADKTGAQQIVWRFELDRSLGVDGAFLVVVQTAEAVGFTVDGSPLDAAEVARYEFFEGWRRAAIGEIDLVLDRSCSMNDDVGDLEWPW